MPACTPRSPAGTGAGYLIGAGYLPDGASAPPPGPEPAADFSGAELFSFSGVAPPAAPPSPEALELSELLAPELPSPLLASPEVLEVEVVLPVLVEVEVVCRALRSALVLAGGVMSGVLFGTTSAVPLPPPQPASAEAGASARTSAMQTRAITR